jgi:hypothetical protein
MKDGDEPVYDSVSKQFYPHFITSDLISNFAFPRGGMRMYDSHDLTVLSTFLACFWRSIGRWVLHSEISSFRLFRVSYDYCII